LRISDKGNAPVLRYLGNTVIVLKFSNPKNQEMKHVEKKEAIVAGGGSNVMEPAREGLTGRDKVIVLLLVYLHLL